MASFTITANSSACGIGTRTITYDYDFSEGTVVYVVAKARKGIIDRVTIKEVIINDLYNNIQDPIILYKNTYNALWNESDVCNQATAYALIESYLTSHQDALTQSLLNCGN